MRPHPFVEAMTMRVALGRSSLLVFDVVKDDNEGGEEARKTESDDAKRQVGQVVGASSSDGNGGSTGGFSLSTNAVTPPFPRNRPPNACLSPRNRPPNAFLSPKTRRESAFFASNESRSAQWTDDVARKVLEIARLGTAASTETKGARLGWSEEPRGVRCSCLILFALFNSVPSHTTGNEMYRGYGMDKLFAILFRF